ncbi:MAG: hypothetical protein RLZZ628_2565, partial [Bacteroidota bacterium]
MDATQLKDIFKSEFQYDAWIKIFRQLFRKVDIFAEPQHHVQKEGTVVYQLGLATLEDGKNLALFTVGVEENKRIVSNRVNLREIAIQYIDQYITHGALVLYYAHAQKRDYRFTFIAKHTLFDEDGLFQQIETHPKRFTYVLGENESCTTAAKRFEGLFQKDKNLIIQDFIEAFSVEKLSKDFFKDYRNKHYSDFITFLTGENADGKSVQDPHEALKTVFQQDKKAARNFVKKLLGRLVFMHFLQKKGWLGVPKTETNWQNGDPAFLQNLFKNCPDKAHFLTKYLNELFFNTLNADRKATKDIFPWTQTRIPYLNGGLFDPDKWKSQSIDFPAPYFASLFDFFDQYNFTIDENDPDEAEIGIDPEMLGHIFENLLEDNKDKGAFYTPKEIVRYMCQESLIQYLKTKLENFKVKKVDNEAIIQLVRYKKLLPIFDNKAVAQEVERLLKGVKICDPAIGSGAFPIGLLQTIYQTRLHLFPKLKSGTAFLPAQVKKEIIQHSIYGVDKEGGAVDIARLRFWLALIVEEAQPEPLPNLDFKIMQGDSLLESFDGIPLDKIAEPKASKVSVKIVNPQIDIFGNIQNGQTEFFTHDTPQTNIQKLLKDYFGANSAQKPALHKQIDQYVLENIHYNLEIHSDRLKIQVASEEKRFKDRWNALRNELQKQKLLESKEAIALQKLKAQVAAKDVQFDILKKLHEQAERPFFLWHTYFKEVFDQGGFDIVIGNPPYIQLQKEGGLLAKMYENLNYKTFERMGDIYALFYEKSHQLLRQGGISAFITSNKWMRAAYGESLRHFFIENTNPLVLLDFGGVQVFESATVDTNILISQKAKNQYLTQSCVLDKSYDRRKDISVFFDQSVTTTPFQSADAWVVLSKEEQTIKQKIEKIGKPLKE